MPASPQVAGIVFDSRRAKLVILLIALGALLLLRADALTVSPSEPHFEARIGETPLLTLEVNCGENPPRDLTADIEGFPCDRRVIAKGNGRFLIQVAPDTESAGPVQGKVLLKAAGKVLDDPIPVSGIIRPWIKSTPSRLFLGSIGHGAQFKNPKTYSVTLISDNAPFDVKKVELEGIAGGNWKCDPPQGLPSQTKRLQFTFSPDAVATDFPFGALATKYILIDTSHEEASRLVVPVMGMLSVNTTGRDYSQYLYQGQVRWQGWWGTPNIAAAFLAAAIVLLCGIGTAIHNLLADRIKWQIANAAVIFATLGMGCYYLVQTYSRGGWVAAGIGIGILLWGIRSPRFYPIGLAALFAALIFIHPNGIKRAASTTMVYEDTSISHRLLLWQGALQMMAEHPWLGVGAGKFGEVFERDYRLPEHTQRYTTAINDFLTLGTERGIPALAIVSSSLLGLVFVGVGNGIHRRNVFLVGCATAIATSLGASWFSSIAFQSDFALGLLFLSAVGIIVGFLWQNWKRKSGQLFRIIFRYFLFWCLGALLLGAMIFFAGQVALSLRPKVFTLNVAGISGLETKPRWGHFKGTILYIGDRDEKAESLLQNTLRPLAKKGWNVLCFDMSGYPSDALEKLRAAILSLKENGELSANYVVAGHRQGAQVAIAFAEGAVPLAVACFDTPYRSAFLDQSPAHLLSTSSRPILLATEKTSEQQLAKLFKGSADMHYRFNAEVDRARFSSANLRWQEWVCVIDKFLFVQKSVTPARRITIKKIENYSSKFGQTRCANPRD